MALLIACLWLLSRRPFVRYRLSCLLLVRWNCAADLACLLNKTCFALLDRPEMLENAGQHVAAWVCKLYHFSDNATLTLQVWALTLFAMERAAMCLRLKFALKHFNAFRLKIGVTVAGIVGVAAHLNYLWMFSIVGEGLSNRGGGREDATDSSGDSSGESRAELICSVLPEFHSVYSVAVILEVFVNIYGPILICAASTAAVLVGWLCGRAEQLSPFGGSLPGSARECQHQQHQQQFRRGRASNSLNGATPDGRPTELATFQSAELVNISARVLFLALALLCYPPLAVTGLFKAHTVHSRSELSQSIYPILYYILQPIKNILSALFHFAFVAYLLVAHRNSACRRILGRKYAAVRLQTSGDQLELQERNDGESGRDQLSEQQQAAVPMKRLENFSDEEDLRFNRHSGYGAINGLDGNSGIGDPLIQHQRPLNHQQPDLQAAVSQILESVAGQVIDVASAGHAGAPQALEQQEYLQRSRAFIRAGNDGLRGHQPLRRAVPSVPANSANSLVALLSGSSSHTADLQLVAGAAQALAYAVAALNTKLAPAVGSNVGLDCCCCCCLRLCCRRLLDGVIRLPPTPAVEEEGQPPSIPVDDSTIPPSASPRRRVAVAAAVAPAFACRLTRQSTGFLAIVDLLADAAADAADKIAATSSTVGLAALELHRASAAAAGPQEDQCSGGRQDQQQEEEDNQTDDHGYSLESTIRTQTRTVELSELGLPWSLAWMVSGNCSGWPSPSRVTDLMTYSVPELESICRPELVASMSENLGRQSFTSVTSTKTVAVPASNFVIDIVVDSVFDGRGVGFIGVVSSHGADFAVVLGLLGHPELVLEAAESRRVVVAVFDGHHDCGRVGRRPAATEAPVRSSGAASLGSSRSNGRTANSSPVLASIWKAPSIQEAGDVGNREYTSLLLGSSSASLAVTNPRDLRCCRCSVADTVCGGSFSGRRIVALPVKDTGGCPRSVQTTASSTVGRCSRSRDRVDLRVYIRSRWLLLDDVDAARTNPPTSSPSAPPGVSLSLQSTSPPGPESPSRACTLATSTFASELLRGLPLSVATTSSSSTASPLAGSSFADSASIRRASDTAPRPSGDSEHAGMPAAGQGVVHDAILPEILVCGEDIGHRTAYWRVLSERLAVVNPLLEYWALVVDVGDQDVQAATSASPVLLLPVQNPVGDHGHPLEPAVAVLVQTERQILASLRVDQPVFDPAVGPLIWIGGSQTQSQIGATHSRQSGRRFFTFSNLKSRRAAGERRPVVVVVGQPKDELFNPGGARPVGNRPDDGQRQLAGLHGVAAWVPSFSLASLPVAAAGGSAQVVAIQASKSVQLGAGAVDGQPVHNDGAGAVWEVHDLQQRPGCLAAAEVETSVKIVQHRACRGVVAQVDDRMPGGRCGWYCSGCEAEQQQQQQQQLSH
uniref:G_PROTEIN_RECEP_F1_2 domain-containing protein n=1 Tax=Macrostomum lignano TaxID=282301 RepID=A0A1I8I621_9PLAT